MKRVPLLNGDYYGVTDEMQAKMAGMWSLNTSPRLNPFCLKMRETCGTICGHCYSEVTESRWKHCHAAWAHNYLVLTNNLLKDEELVIFKDREVFRFQAHGDLGNRTHYINLARIAEANPKVKFALWTKNLEVIKDGGMIKLPNLVHVYSTPKLNQLKPVRPKGFDKVFSVYDRPFLREHTEIEINCAKSCNECRICYAKNDIHIVNEKIKAPASRD